MRRKTSEVELIKKSIGIVHQLIEQGNGLEEIAKKLSSELRVNIGVDDVRIGYKAVVNADIEDEIEEVKEVPPYVLEREKEKLKEYGMRSYIFLDDE